MFSDIVNMTLLFLLRVHLALTMRLAKNEGIACYQLSPKHSVFKYMIDIYKLTSKQDFDSVYIHGNSAMMFIEALPVWLAGKRIIITHCHNTSSKYPFFHKLFKPFFNQIVSRKIACSKDAAEWAYCGDNIKIVVNGVDVEKFAFDPDKREEKRKELGWDTAYVIGHIGRFNLQKNHSFLIEVFEKVQQKLPESRLLLIGTGELEDKIKQMVTNKGIEKKFVFWVILILLQTMYRQWMFLCCQVYLRGLV